MTGHSVWSHDAHVVMEDYSHLKLIAMGLLQTCGYVTEQMQTPVTIDVNKFLESFSIKADGEAIHPPTWTASEGNSVSFSPNVAIHPGIPSSTLTPTPNPFTMDHYIQCRKTEAIRWLDLQEKRASIMARLQPVKAEEYQERRESVNSVSGPLRRKGMKFYFNYEFLIPYLHRSKRSNTSSDVQT